MVEQREEGTEWLTHPKETRKQQERTNRDAESPERRLAGRGPQWQLGPEKEQVYGGEGPCLPSRPVRLSVPAAGGQRALGPSCVVEEGEDRWPHVASELLSLHRAGAFSGNSTVPGALASTGQITHGTSTLVTGARGPRRANTSASRLVCCEQ